MKGGRPDEWIDLFVARNSRNVTLFHPMTCNNGTILQPLRRVESLAVDIAFLVKLRQ